MKQANSRQNVGLWLKTNYANLVRNSSSGIYFARFRHNGKLIWRGLSTDVLSGREGERFIKEIETSGSGFSQTCAELVQFLAYGGFRITEAKHITWV